MVFPVISFITFTFCLKILVQKRALNQTMRSLNFKKIWFIPAFSPSSVFDKDLAPALRVAALALSS